MNWWFWIAAAIACVIGWLYFTDEAKLKRQALKSENWHNVRRYRNKWWDGQG